MPIFPIDLQVQFAQLGNLSKIVSQSEVAAHNQALAAGEHVANMSEVVDHTVTQAEEMPGEGNTITGDGENQNQKGSSQNQDKDSGKENEDEKNKVNFEPDLGNIIDIRE